MTLRSLSREIGGEIVLKAENLQRTGSFKLRGALAKLRGVEPAKCKGVVAGSAGNHAQSLAYAARSAGLPCRVYMPAAAAISKVDAVEAFGGEVVQGGGSVDECVGLAKDAAEAEGLLFVHPFDDPEVIRGQAGVGVELIEQVEDLRRVVVPVGGGGLASGVAMAVKLARPEVEVIGVQAAGCAPMTESLREGRPVGARPGKDDRRRHRGEAPGRGDPAAARPLAGRDGRGRGRRDRRGDGLRRRAGEADHRGGRSGGGGGAADGRGGAGEGGRDGGRPIRRQRRPAGSWPPRSTATRSASTGRVRLITRVDDHPGGLADLLQGDRRERRQHPRGLPRPRPH